MISPVKIPYIWFHPVAEWNFHVMGWPVLPVVTLLLLGLYKLIELVTAFERWL